MALNNPNVPDPAISQLAKELGKEFAIQVSALTKTSGSYGGNANSFASMLPALTEAFRESLSSLVNYQAYQPGKAWRSGLPSIPPLISEQKSANIIGPFPMIGPKSPPADGSVNPTQQVPDVPRPTYNPGGGVTGIVKGGTDLLAHRIHTGTLRQQTSIASSFNLSPGQTVGSTPGTDGLHPVLDSNGSQVGSMTPEDFSSMSTKLGGISKSRSIIAGGLAGAGAAGGIMGGVLDAVPELAVAGIAVDAVKQIPQVVGQLADQRQQNAQYQAIYGGSNMAGMGQRISGDIFGLSEMGGIGTGQAGQLFQGISSLGLQGGTRQSAINLALTEFYKYGVSIQQTLDLITTAAKSGNTSLTGLAEGIDQVSKSAAQNGISGISTRNTFTSNLQTLAASSGVTTGTIAAAGGQVSSQARLGQTFAGGNATILNALNSNQAQQQYAITAGTNLEGIQAMAGGGIAGGQAYNSAMNATVVKFLGPEIAAVVGLFPTFLEPGETAQELASDIPSLVNKVQAWDSARGGAMTMTVTNTLQQLLGVQLDPNTAMQFFIGVALGQWSGGTAGWNPAATTKNQIAASTPKAISKATASAAGTVSKATGGGLLSQVVGQVTQGAFFNNGVGQTVKQLPKSQQGPINQILQSIGATPGKPLTQDESLYMNDTIKKTGMTNPVLAALIKNTNTKNDKFAVTTKGGKTTYVDLATLIADYGDQAEAGTATFATNDSGNIQQSVATAMGLQGNPAVATPSANRAAVGAISKSKIAAQNNKGGKNPIVTISATPYLLQLLNITPSNGSVVVNSTTGNNTPPPAYGYSPSQYPGTPFSSGG
jgi:hypothetical protein